MVFSLAKVFGGLGVAALLLTVRPASAQILFSGGSYRTPETISAIPNGFGTLGGDYLIPDANRGNTGGQIWRVAQSGGPPTTFANAPDRHYRGGVFLPGSGWGSHSGDFLAVGQKGDGTTGAIDVYSSDGQMTALVSTANTSFTTPALAPGSFGAFGGDVVVGDQANNQVVALTPGGTTSVLAGNLAIQPFGLAFAPDGFGAVGGDLLASDNRGSAIAAIASNGTAFTFADVALKAGQTGLRQMAFSPAGFIPGYGSLLFVSVSGSNTGGGTLGDVYGLDGSGNIVVSFRNSLGLTKFDPRGLTFIGNGQLLISDSSDPIYLADASNFAPAVPEASSFTATGIGLLGLGFLMLCAKKRAVKAKS